MLAEIIYYVMPQADHPLGLSPDEQVRRIKADNAGVVIAQKRSIVGWSHIPKGLWHGLRIGLGFGKTS